MNDELYTYTVKDFVEEFYYFIELYVELKWEESYLEIHLYRHYIKIDLMADVLAERLFLMFCIPKIKISISSRRLEVNYFYYRGTPICFLTNYIEKTFTKNR